MTELQTLYQEVILDHYKHPRNWGRLPTPDRTAAGDNPLCGDRITIDVALDGDVIKDVRINGAGCAISVASASLMSEAIKGRTIAEADALFTRFRHLVTGHAELDRNGPLLGKLEVFGGVARYPARVKCAALAWHALHAALQDQAATVTTE